MPPDAPAVRSSRSYAMHGAIAAGGMAAVHLGRLVAGSGFSRRVAIKRLHAPFASDPEIAATFAEEARLAARVAHVNVAAMLDVVSADGELFLIMEYVHGESLARLLKGAREARAAVPIPILVSVLADVLHGLHAAHEATDERGAPLRIVHRDVSPQNVIVGVDGVARVVDFGIAKAMTHSQLTRDGQLKGKMPYMAPEQLLQRAIDRRVDVYAAGVVLWEALTGRRLFEGNDSAVLFAKIVEEPQPVPSSVDPRVPAALDAIVMRALERDPERRFPTALDMARAVEEAGPRAPASAVAGWTATTASEALAKRAALIAEMEREAGGDGGTRTRAYRAPSASVIFRDAAAPGEAAGEAAATPAATAAQGKGVRRGVWAAGGAAVLVAIVTGGVWMAASRASAGADASGAAAASVRDDVAAAPSSSSPPGSSAAATDAPGVSTSAATAVASSSPPATPRQSAPPPHAAAAARWCKIFDANKRIFVMKEMRVARCP